MITTLYSWLLSPPGIAPISFPIVYRNVFESLWVHIQWEMYAFLCMCKFSPYVHKF